MNPDLFLKHMRERLGWTQAEFAEHLGYKTGTIAAWENRRNEVPIIVLRWLYAVKFALDAVESSPIQYGVELFTFIGPDGIQYVEKRLPAEIIFEDGVDMLFMYLLEREKRRVYTAEKEDESS